MATKPSTSRDKPVATVYTLPLACQICLGKVKQPVLCSNYHVFCGTCISTWRERSDLCPSCRIPIDHTNPVKHIRGGLSQAEDEEETRSTPELRKTRFELIYREYEDMLEKFDSEVKLLKTENSLLKSQLSAQQGSGGVGGGGSGKGSGVGAVTSEQQLQLLTRKLQDAQKLYDAVKKDISRLKQENSSLKETNSDLVRENAKLREEVSHRSPHRYGRLTVATLESQLGTQKKEIQRLTKALERSDQYIEKLNEHLQWDQTSSKHTDKQNKLSTDSSKPPPEHKETTSISLGKEFSSSYTDVKKHLDTHMSLPPPGQKNLSDDGDRHYESLQVKRQLFSGQSSSRLQSDQSRPASRPLSSKISNNTHPSSDPDTVLESALRRSDQSLTPDCERKAKPKKVQFNLNEKKSNETSSFNLEVPSPLTSSPLGKCGESPDKHLGEVQTSELLQKHNRQDKPSQSSSVSHKLSWNVGTGSQTKNEDRHTILHSGRLPFHNNKTENYLSSESLSQKWTSDTMKNGKVVGQSRSSYLSERGRSTPPSLSELDQSLPTTAVKATESSKAKGVKKSKTHGPDKNVSFDLEGPSLDDTQTIQSELNDLDISMTPELSDCLKLLNRAEKKVSNAESPYFSAQTGKPERHSAPVDGEGMRNVHVHGSVASSYIPGTTGSLSSWEHGFFSSLRVNPYKHAAPLTHLSTASHNPNFTTDKISQSHTSFGISTGQALSSGPGKLPFQLPFSSDEESAGPAVGHLEGKRSSRTEFPASGTHGSSYAPHSQASTEAFSSAGLSYSRSSSSLPQRPTSASSAAFRNAEDMFSLPPRTVGSSASASVAQPVTSFASSLPPSSTASSSGFSLRDADAYSLPWDNFSSRVAEGRNSAAPAEMRRHEGDWVSRETQGNKNYSYVSTTSSQGDNTDSFFPEPKKRLFDFDSEEETGFETPSKTTKTEQRLSSKGKWDR